MPLLAFVNHSARVTDAQVSVIAAAVQLQYARDFAPAHDLVAMQMIAVAKGHSAPTGARVLGVIDKADLDGAYGYHTDEGGSYDGFLFVDPVLDNGGTVLGNPSRPGDPCVASVGAHEAMELGADTTCNKWADCGAEITLRGVSFREVAWEVSDAVEGDGYIVNVGRQPVCVSNFVLPAWFDPLAPRGTRRDFMGKLHASFSMDDGGYMAVRDGARNEREVFGEAMPAWKRTLKSSIARRARISARRRHTQPPQP